MSYSVENICVFQGTDGGCGRRGGEQFWGLRARADGPQNRAQAYPPISPQHVDARFGRRTLGAWNPVQVRLAGSSAEVLSQSGEDRPEFGVLPLDLSDASAGIDHG